VNKMGDRDRPKSKTLTVKRVSEVRYNKRDIETSIDNLTQYLGKLEEELEQWKLRRDILLGIDEKNEEIIIEEKYKDKKLDVMDVVDLDGRVIERKYTAITEDVTEEVVEEPPEIKDEEDVIPPEESETPIEDDIPEVPMGDDELPEEPVKKG
jgi:hypothetical protein